MAGAAVELVSVRAIGIGRTVKPDLTPTDQAGVGRRRARPRVGRGRCASTAAPRRSPSTSTRAPTSAPVTECSGPALVDGLDTTVWIPRPHAARRRTEQLHRGGRVMPDVERQCTSRSLRASTRSASRCCAPGSRRSATSRPRRIERTAISPVVTESKDYSATLLDGEGNLVIGGGRIEYHFGAATNAVRSTHRAPRRHDRARRRVPRQRPAQRRRAAPAGRDGAAPVFVGDELVAWVVMSAHLMDMGGMVIGSFAPAATECYQEAMRFPPVRLFREGVEEPDVWAIFRNNVRLGELVEMDLRGLVAGCHVAAEKLVEVVQEMGVPDFVDGMRGAVRLHRGRAAPPHRAIADGKYRTVTWTEWDDELYAVPCTLTVAGDTPRLRLRRRVTAGAALLQLEALHHRERAGRRRVHAARARTCRSRTGSSGPSTCAAPKARS